MDRPVLHQFLDGSAVGDAITDQALLIRRWTRSMGIRSEIYAEHIHPDLAGEIKPASSHRLLPYERWVIYHHSIGSTLAPRLCSLPVQQILIYHNVTPPDFLAGANPALARQLEEGRQQLAMLRAHTALALADSPYNERDLKAAQFERTDVLPIALAEENYDLPVDAALQAQFTDAGPLLLFVGRLVPNKKQEDLIKLLYFYRKIEPAARLVLVGDPWLREYAEWLSELAWDLDLQDAVLFAGHVSQRQLITYYRLADLYVSMSEHEGFGKPLIESMHLGLPVLAYASSAVPDTLGEAGVLFRHKHYEAIAELVDILVKDEALRARIVRRQRQRAAQFMQTQVCRRWQEIVRSLW